MLLEKATKRGPAHLYTISLGSIPVCRHASRDLGLVSLTALGEPPAGEMSRLSVKALWKERLMYIQDCVQQLTVVHCSCSPVGHGPRKNKGFFVDRISGHPQMYEKLFSNDW